MPDPTVDQMLQLAHELGLDGVELGDLVHDVASHHPSHVNNRGLAAQIAFLTAELGAAGTR